tara:strand:+ start:1043 stop:1453 length:411 start_codon:yes stop_codon:yes gene_type:complete
MADVRWIFQKEAIKFLAEGDPSKVIDILKDGVELTDEFRNDLAAFIEGAHPSKVRLKVSHPKGPHRKQLANFPRDYAAHQTICEYREETGKAADYACAALAVRLGMSGSALEKLHDAFNKADAVMRDIDRESAGHK